MAHVPIAMKEKSSTWSEKITHQRKAGTHHTEIRIHPRAPGIAIGFFFDSRLLLFDLFTGFTDHGCKRKIGPSGEWWIDVDQVNFPRELLQKRPHHEQIVAPDELVLPPRFQGVALVALVEVE